MLANYIFIIFSKTSAIADAAYNSIWPNVKPKDRVLCLLMIMRSQEPFHCTAYGLFSIGHVQITNVKIHFYIMYIKNNQFLIYFSRIR